ncbi:hypothetical protein KP003_17310 [Geomonas nitrogeniifigens]|uniref:Uncharacterized protein n=1 Tax=Geomonas diazotrophica TaxID=2843197 RepID=A0ABX8JJW3_9BACT|nr:hypothetical protein [Geomonas nitrogeniifigens]QWV96924.1 hypothetical protein KP005_16460 [Geomonas nitrogeniifigens]QXE86100.1 hypothetical protein KP003_17310 [Geomonas nitrogeniifigens]
MGVIIDTLIIALGEPTILTKAFPGCEINRLTPADSTIQRYRVALKDEDEQSYFDFLQDNCMAMTSNRFYFRMKSDKSFADRMRGRFAGNCGRK